MCIYTRDCIIYSGIQKSETTSKNAFILHYLKNEMHNVPLQFINKRFNERASYGNQEYLTKIQNICAYPNPE